ncbi:MAG TPA: hypothetical protein VNI83_04610 [Vicinamibacterales bacterium]|nr:hypothetical protein [Vicinamibacterales bacterium]
MASPAERLRRYGQAAREIERYARLRLYEATGEAERHWAQALLRNAIGVRKALERWPMSETSIPASPDGDAPSRLAVIEDGHGEVRLELDRYRV